MPKQKELPGFAVVDENGPQFVGFFDDKDSAQAAAALVASYQPVKIHPMSKKAPKEPKAPKHPKTEV